jgi:hypothetical protein
MISESYRNFCETMWSDWRAKRLSLPPRVSDRFQLDHAPEPYLRFGEGSRPLYALFTNPGIGMSHQRHDVVQAGASCIRPDMSYYEASLALGAFYRSDLPQGAARTRNDALDHLRRLVGKDCIVLFESLPFHSKALPGKHAIPKLVLETQLLRKYISLLTEALKHVSVIALSAVDSSESISAASVVSNSWLSWQANILGLNPPDMTVVPLVPKGSKITSAFLYQKVSNCIRGFVLTMGGNTFPATEGRKKIARAYADVDV